LWKIHPITLPADTKAVPLGVVVLAKTTPKELKMSRLPLPVGDEIYSVENKE
jgi:hypothetical protein